MSTVITDPTEILTLFRDWAEKRAWETAATLSEDGTQLTSGTSAAVLDATVPLSLDGADKPLSKSYSAASVYLQMRHPRSLLEYRNACKQYKVADPIGALDKAVVVRYFGGSSDAAAAATASSQDVSSEPAKAAEAAAATPSKEAAVERHRKDKKHKDKRKKDHKRSSTGSTAASDRKKKPKTVKLVTNEELLGNLSSMVDKRTADHKAAEITAALSAEGFDVTPALLEDYQEITREILANEIPVGDSASILRAAATKDLTRVLEVYKETEPKASTRRSKSSSSNTSNAKSPAKKSYLVGKRPVIVVPKGMTAPLTLMNAHEFFANGRFVPLQVMRQNKQKTTPVTRFTRSFGSGSSSSSQISPQQLVEFEITDNPKRLLGVDLREWERIVAVIVLGQAWQFSDWFDAYKKPVQLFSRTFGFYVSLEGDTMPADVKEWAVQKAKLNRDKRGLDSVTSAAFWNGLEEFMKVHKRELLPQTED